MPTRPEKRVAQNRVVDRPERIRIVPSTLGSSTIPCAVSMTTSGSCGGALSADAGAASPPAVSASAATVTLVLAIVPPSVLAEGGKSARGA
jgi:hypothetical protein